MQQKRVKLDFENNTYIKVSHQEGGWEIFLNFTEWEQFKRSRSMRLVNAPINQTVVKWLAPQQINNKLYFVVQSDVIT